MSENERDSHFAGFAKSLWTEIEQAQHDLNRDIETIIAQRAFDFAEHVIKHLHGSDVDDMKDEGLSHFLEVSYPNYTRLPDFTEWPNTSRS